MAVSYNPYDNPALMQFLTTPRGAPNALMTQADIDAFNIARGAPVLTQQNQGNPVNRPALYSQQLAPFQRSSVPFARPTAPNAPQYRGSVGAQMFARANQAAAQGGNAMLGGMAQGFNEGRMNEYNAAMNQYNADMAQYQDGVARYNAAVEAARANDQERVAALEGFDDSIGAMMKSYQNLQDMNITGPFAGYVGAFLDKAGIRFDGDAAAKRQGARLLLKKLQVDATLLNTANTKGAISDREMALFMSPQPDMLTSEKAWQDWIKVRTEALIKVRNRIANGQQVPPEDRVQSGTLQSVYGFLNDTAPAEASSSQPSNNQPTPSKGPVVEGKYGSYQQVQ